MLAMLIYFTTLDASTECTQVCYENRLVVKKQSYLCTTDKQSCIHKSYCRECIRKGPLSVECNQK